MLTKDYLLKYLKNIYDINVKRELEFFDIPNALDLLKGASIAAAYALLEEYKQKLENALQSYDSKDDETGRKSPLSYFNDPTNISSDDVKRMTKQDKNLRDFFKNVDKDINDEAVSDIIKACGNEEEYYNTKKDKIKKSLESKDFDPQTFLKNVEENNDVERRSEKNKNTFQSFNNNKNVITKVRSGIYLLIIAYFLIDNLVDFLETTEFPSYYRSKFLQKITSNLLTSVKEIGEEQLIPEAQNLISTLKRIDAIVIGIVVASFLYLDNRKKLQELSTESFKKSVSQLNCEEPQTDLSPEEVDPDINGPIQLPLDSSIENFSCPIDTSDEVTPHRPFEKQVEDFTCEMPGDEEQDTSVEEKIQEDISRKAKINNLSPETFEKNVNIGDFLEIGDKIGRINDMTVFSPTIGEVYKIEKNAIYLKDVEEGNTNFINDPLEEIRDSYEKIKNIKEFIKNFYIQSHYPILLRNVEKDMPEYLEKSIGSALDTIGYIPRTILNQIANLFPNIEYLVNGISERFDVMISDFEDAKETHDENVSEISGETNVKNKAEKEETSKIKEELDTEEQNFFKKLKEISSRGINQSKVTIGREDDYMLSEYFTELFTNLSSFDEDNDVIASFRNKIRGFLINRIFIEKYDIGNIKDKINDYAQKLSKNKNNYFDAINDKYENNDKSETSVKNFLKNITHNDIETHKRDILIQKIISLFLLYKEVRSLKEKNYEVKVDKDKLLIRESNYIQNFLSEKWNELKSSEKKIDENINSIKEKSQSFVQPTSEIIDDEEFKVYTIKGQERECPEPEEEHPNLSPFSEYGKGDIQYWLKYCGIATLVSLTNPSGWSTGLIPPVGPTLFPVVYIPLVSFYTDYGFIVIGITVTGTYIFPFGLFTNLSTQYRVPIADPAAFLKRQVDNLKDNILSSLQSYRQVSLKEYLEKTKNQLEEKNNEIDDLSEQLRNLRESKPKRDRTKNNRYVQQSGTNIAPNWAPEWATNIIEEGDDTLRWADDYLNYNARLGIWQEKKQEINASLLQKKTEKYALEVKHKIAYEAYKGAPMQNSDDPELISLKETEKNIEASFDQLNELIQSIDDFLAPLPISLFPQSGNFAYTIKNPKPIIKIESDFSTNEIINQETIDNVFSQFKLDKNILMSSNLEGKTEDSILNFSKYKSTLAPLMNIIIPIDPFPKYENLKITYIPWTIKFLYPHWATVGAQTFGYPGFPPFPTS